MLVLRNGVFNSEISTEEMQMLRPTTSDQFRPEWIWNASYSTRETRLGWLYRRHGTVMVVIQLFQFLGQHEIHEWKIGIKAYSILLQRGPDWAGFIGYMGQWWWWWSRHRDRTLVILMLGLGGKGRGGGGKENMKTVLSCFHLFAEFGVTPGANFAKCFNL